MYFCHCVRKYMLEDPVSEENLNSLLHFRTSTAHDVRYADQTKHTSLIASICSGEMQLRIPFAGPQVFLRVRLGVSFGQSKEGRQEVPAARAGSSRGGAHMWPEVA